MEDVVSFLSGLAWIPVSLILLAFTLRRMLLTAAVFLAPRRTPVHGSDDHLPQVLILVPCRDEEAMITGLGEALARLDYPADKYQVVLIDDSSHDRTRPRMEELARAHSNFHVLGFSENRGKAQALNIALARFTFGDIVYVFDADHRPRPECLRVAVRYFREPDVAGVSGRTIPSNALASPSAYYSTVESSVHQMVTMRAKDRLGLAPALLGSNCGYRRDVLERCGGFRPGALLEDSDLTLVFYRAGYRVRFAEEAIAYHLAPETVDGYLKQHARWARGFNDVARDHALQLVRGTGPSLLLRADLLLFALGYVDRIALLGAGLLSILSLFNPRLFRSPRWVLYCALLTPLAQIVALFAEQRMPVSMWLRLPFVPLFFALDILAAARAMIDSLLNRARVWAHTERARTS